MRKVRMVAILSAMALTSAAAGTSDRLADFRVGGVSFRLPIPAGYCLPSGRMADVMQLLAAGDTENVTDLSLAQCVDKMLPGASDYTIIKTPRRGLLVTVDRAELLTAVGKEFDKKLDTSPMLDAAGKSVSGVAGTKISISGTFGPRGKDDVCAYMGGVLHYESRTMTYDQPMGGCITAVGGRVLYIYRTGTKNDEAGILDLMRESRAIALSIKTTGDS